MKVRQPRTSLLWALLVVGLIGLTVAAQAWKTHASDALQADEATLRALQDVLRRSPRSTTTDLAAMEALAAELKGRLADSNASIHIEGSALVVSGVSPSVLMTALVEAAPSHAARLILVETLLLRDPAAVRLAFEGGHP